METRILLVCREGAALEAYRAALDPQPVQLELAHTIGALESTLVETPFNGLLLDMETMFEATDQEKQAARALLDLYPVIRVKWDEQRQAILSLYYGEVGDGSISLDDFIWRHCAPFAARSVRRSVRRSLHLNVLAGPDAEFRADDALRGNTLDVSEDGCFLYCTQDWQGRLVAWLQPVDFADRTPIMAHVRWACAWGTADRLPGLGLEFAGMTSAQAEELRRRIFPYTDDGDAGRS